MMDDRKQAMLDRLTPDDEEWTTDGLGVIICPCGHRIEDDGRCPEGHVSPLRDAGLI